MCGAPPTPPTPPVSTAHSIVLQVNTANIPPSPTTTELIDANCSFQGNSNGVSNENFVIIAANNDTITWSGISVTNPGVDTVVITDIDYEDGKNLFGNSDLQAASGAASITGTIVNAQNNDAESYVIKFAVYNSGVLRGNYQIDPKIQIRATQ